MQYNKRQFNQLLENAQKDQTYIHTFIKSIIHLKYFANILSFGGIQLVKLYIKHLYTEIPPLYKFFQSKHTIFIIYSGSLKIYQQQNMHIGQLAEGQQFGCFHQKNPNYKYMAFEETVLLGVTKEKYNMLFAQEELRNRIFSKNQKKIHQTNLKYTKQLFYCSPILRQISQYDKLELISKAKLKRFSQKQEFSLDNEFLIFINHGLFERVVNYPKLQNINIHYAKKELYKERHKHQKFDIIGFKQMVQKQTSKFEFICKKKGQLALLKTQHFLKIVNQINYPQVQQSIIKIIELKGLIKHDPPNKFKKAEVNAYNEEAANIKLKKQKMKLIDSFKSINLSSHKKDIPFRCYIKTNLIHNHQKYANKNKHLATQNKNLQTPIKQNLFKPLPIQELQPRLIKSKINSIDYSQVFTGREVYERKIIGLFQQYNKNNEMIQTSRSRSKSKESNKSQTASKFFRRKNNSRVSTTRRLTFVQDQTYY